MDRTVETTKNRFFEIFADSVLLYELSESESRELPQTVLAKSCLLSVNYALEAAANSFLSSIDISARIKEQVDKFSTLDKFDFVLQWHKDDSLPRGDTKVQVIQELISKRNSAVHPKITYGSENITTTKGSGSLAFLHQSKNCAEPSRSKLSNISLDPEQYTDEDALIALQAFVDFLNSYVTDWWGIDLDMSALLLMPSWSGSIQAGSVMYERKALETVVKHNQKLKVKFIGLHGILERFV